MKQKVIGTGITKRQITSTENPQEIATMLEAFFKQKRAFGFEDAILKKIKGYAWTKFYEKHSPQAVRAFLNRIWPSCGKTARETETSDAKISRTIIAALSLTNDHPDSKAGYAARLLNLIRIIRKVRTKGSDMALSTAFELGELTMESRMKFRWEPKVMKAEKFEQRRRRRDSLSMLIERAYAGLHKERSKAPTWRDVLDNLKRFDGDRIIDEIDDDGSIEWHFKGTDKTTAIKSFRNRLTVIKKQIMKK